MREDSDWEDGEREVERGGCCGPVVACLLG